jgi:hypothetical protein
MDRFMIDSIGPDDVALRDAIVWLADVAGRMGLDGAIYVGTLKSIEAFDRVLDPYAMQQLRSARAFNVDGARLQLVPRRSRPARFAGPMLVPWASPTTLAEAEAMEPSTLGATGWAPGELDEWKRVHGPVDIRTGKPIETDKR